MKNKRYTKKQLHKKKHRAILGFITSLILFCLASGILVAKYYANKYEKGIAVASAFYFNSNNLIKNTGPTTEDGIRNMDVSNMPVNINQSKWVSGDCLFDIEIRNYDNSLLFNENGLNVEYKIYFYLIGTPQGASYYVSEVDDATNNTANESKLTTTNPMKYFSANLPGGTLSKKQYRIRIYLDNPEQYNESAKVLAVAYPTSPDYLCSEDKQEHRLVGVFQGHCSEANMSVDLAEFQVQGESDYNDTTWHDKVQDLSGLIFNIKTTGDVVTDANNAVKQEAIVKWKSEYVQISEYDEYYLTAKSMTESDSTWLQSVTDADGTKWMYMKIKVLPYSSVNITFYKTKKFIDDFGSMKKTAFEGIADAYVEYTEN